jgi:2-oxoglutarate dehydrogenase E2 component (dihydrolipoamide succinyltransferase)
MPVEVKVPSVGESITEVTISEWLIKEGEWVAQDAHVVVLETDKVNVEVPSPASGIILKHLVAEGESASVGDIIAHLEEAERPAAEASPKEAAAVAEAEGAAPPATAASGGDQRVTPAARRVLAEHGLDAADVLGTGPGGRLLKEDVLRHVESGAAKPAPAAAPAPKRVGGAREEELVPMTPLRKTVARRLVEATQTTAMLTTFNEVDMSAVMGLRSAYKEAFLKKYDIKLGFMSFFVKAAVDALKLVPEVNAEIRGQDIVYKNYFDIGVAVGGGKGLVVPVIRNTEHLSFAEVELTITDLGTRARANKLKLEELQGGTFTISNGGIYGSMMSTPILNPPQSGILGMHNIQERPVAVNGEVVIRPMMYIALSYDHRIVDGRGAVTFLKRIKECVEDPARMILEV